MYVKWMSEIEMWAEVGRADRDLLEKKLWVGIQKTRA